MVFTVVTMVVPVRSVKPKALATASLVWTTTSLVIVATLAPSYTAPVLAAATVVSALMLRTVVPVPATPTAIRLEPSTMAEPVASST